MCKMCTVIHYVNYSRIQLSGQFSFATVCKTYLCSGIIPIVKNKAYDKFANFISQHINFCLLLSSRNIASWESNLSFHCRCNCRTKCRKNTLNCRKLPFMKLSDNEALIYRCWQSCKDYILVLLIIARWY